MNKTIISGVILGLFSTTSFASSTLSNEQKIFKEALTYTVKIKSNVRYPFGDNKKGSSNGAGILINKEKGLIMTNAHVVSKSPSTLNVIFNDGEPTKATKVYVDTHLDVAIISIDPKIIPKDAITPSLECDELPSVGTSIGAFGHPIGFSFTGTKGIVSGINYKLDTELIQIDASINPGNSGGPLIDFSTGKVIGINTSTIKNAQNTSFATPMKYACTIYKILLQGGNPQPQNTEWFYYKNDNDQKTLKISHIFDRFKDKTSLNQGDIILGVQNNPLKVKSETQLVDIIRGKGNTIPFLVKRANGIEDIINVTLEYSNPIIKERGLLFSGILLGELDVEFREFSKNSKLFIMHVEDGTSSETSEIYKGDVLHSLDGKTFESLEEINNYLSAKAQEKDAKVTISIKRIGASTNALFGFYEKEVVLEKPIWIENK